MERRGRRPLHLVLDEGCLENLLSAVVEVEAGVLLVQGHAGGPRGVQGEERLPQAEGAREAIGEVLILGHEGPPAPQELGVVVGDAPGGALKVLETSKATLLPDPMKFFSSRPKFSISGPPPRRSPH